MSNGTAVEYGLAREDGWTKMVRRDVQVHDISRGIPDPLTVLDILRRRKECRETYLTSNGKDEYGLEIARAYQRRVI